MRQKLRRDLIFNHCTLDRQQHEAVIACEDAQLVLASAGSGKTLSLMAKIQYLLDELKLPPPAILVISFTNKTVRELVERCSVADVEIRTFHSLGNRLLQFNERRGLGRKKLVSGSESLTFIRRTVWQRCCEDQVFIRRLNDYLLFYYSAPQSVGAHRSHAAKIRFNQRHLRRHLQTPTPHRRSNLRSSPVRSKELELLANWLFVHQINFTPNAPYPHASNYRPSFTLHLGKQALYLDVVELKRNGQSFYGLEYLRNCRWRRRLHLRHKTPYLQLRTADFSDNSAAKQLARFLKRHGLTPRRRSEFAIQQAVFQSPNYRQDFEALQNYFCSYITQFKNSLATFSQLQKHIKGSPDAYQRRRARAFLKLFRPLFFAYQNWLDNKQAYDFVDMINDATQTVREVAECAVGYRYILLDEAQDLSPNRFALIRAILDKNPSCRFFAVGDDWQSIYRFTGSRLDLIHHFEQHFHLSTRRSLIERTHRFGTPTIRLSSDFIMKNPEQVRKQIRGDRSKQTPINVVLSEHYNDDTSALLCILKELAQRPDFAELELQIVSRYNHDINRLKSCAALTVISPELLRYRDKDIPFCSMHKSKGITRDIVIVLNMNSSSTGMPATRENDPLTDLLLADAEAFPFAEERRLFYVAITRARQATFLIAERKRPSPFLFEISAELNELYQKLCPRCQTGELLRKGNTLYCSNFRFGCDYLKRHPA